MKTYKVKYLAIAVALFGATMAASCNKEFSLNGLRINVENYQTDEKTAVSGVNIHWVNGDPIRINGARFEVTVDGSNVAVTNGDDVDVSGGIYAYSPYSMTVSGAQTTTPTVTFPSRFLSSFDGDRQIIDLPMVAYAASDATSINFKHISSAVNVRVRNSTNNVLYIDSVILDAYYQICGQRTLDLTNAELGLGTLPNTQGSSGQRVVTVFFEANSVSIAPGAIKDIQVPVLPYRGSSTTVNVFTHNAITGASMPVQPHTFYMRSSMPSLSRNHLCTAQIDIRPTNSNVTSGGVFKVGDNKYVYFSQGNLQYYGSVSAPHWNFAADQWTANFCVNSGADASVPIDLFGWAANGYNNGQGLGYQVKYTVANNAEYQLGGTTGNISDISTADWGYNSIENGGNVGGFWRTLTYDEWDYLLNHRSYSSSRKGLATVNGVQGLVLLPSVLDTAGLNLPRFVNTMNSWVGGEGSPNVYSGSDWTKWENAGAVFLPITGNRQGSSFGGSIAGFYWISTRHSGDKAKCLYFTKSVSPSSVLTNYDLFRGHAVRLVRDAN